MVRLSILQIWYKQFIYSKLYWKDKNKEKEPMFGALKKTEKIFFKNFREIVKRIVCSDAAASLQRHVLIFIFDFRVKRWNEEKLINEKNSAKIWTKFIKFCETLFKQSLSKLQMMVEVFNGHSDKSLSDRNLRLQSR